jgi:acetylornithine deacetylase/succinyl-diaminopimelate desuccinylase-like protein
MTDANGSVKDALKYLDQHFEEFKATLIALSKIPSISADGFPPEEVRRSAEATADVMREVGVENVQILAIEGVHPYVYGDWIKKPGAPTILLYGHHDVQPPGRPEKWLSPAFEPTERKGRLLRTRHRDDKAGVMAHVAAVACYLKSAGAIPCNVKFLIEGEEEIGSENLGRFLEKYKDMMAADFIVLSDTANFDTGIPALTYQLRGITQVDVEVQVLDHPLHSGMWGGPVPDPVQVLSKLIAGPHGQGRQAEDPGPLRAGREADRQAGEAHPQASVRREAVQARRRPGEGRFARGRAEVLGIRAAVDAAVADRDRDGVAPDRGLVEPDRRLGARPSLAADGAEREREEGGRVAREEADEEAALRREGDREGHRATRRGGRPTRRAPRSRRRGAR